MLQLNQKKKEFNVPHTFVIIFTILILVIIATWLIPGGEYERAKNAAGRTIAVSDSFKFVENTPANLKKLLTAPLKGFTSKADVAGFILIVGGAFAVIQKTNAIDTGILGVVRKLKGKEFLIIPLIMTLFSVGGAVFGMAEETIPFAAIFVPLALALGYDSITGMCLAFVGATVGFSSAMLNPFTVGIAKGIAETPMKAGIIYRTTAWAIFTIAAIVYVMIYANKVKKNPHYSIMYEEDTLRKNDSSSEMSLNTEFTTSHKLIILTLFVGIALIVYGVLKWEWYLEEITAVFLAMAIISGFIGKLNFNVVADTFIAGAKDVLGAALVVGLANAIVIVATDAKIMDTILYSLAKAIEPLPRLFSGYAMLIIQSIINFFVGSGTGQAALTIPIMYPLGELVGISRETSILIYQFGNGFTDLVFPTSGVLMGTLALAKIPYEKWFKWVLKALVFLSILQLLLITPAILFPGLLQ
ncbi:YfcC family protein [Clostridium peptidivorans]|uniref:YfcC family protein n=1 Tax=Clostridium peptidivorans TaxID=100174 RepID=UPI000BE41255|nr:Na+/H+ antiporter NhaC family protein [Clostridium peptidivorans]